MSVQRWTSLNECLLDENDRISESVDSRGKPPPPTPKKKENVSKSYNTRRHFLSYKPDVGACCNGSLASSNPLDWNLRRKPMQTNKQPIKEARYNGFISVEMLLKAIPLVDRDS